MSANCATWTSERIELLKRYLQAGLSCGQIAREIGVTRNAVIGKRNRLGLSRPKDVIGRRLEQRRAARLARPKTPRTWRPRRPRLNIFAQHERLMAVFSARSHLLKRFLSTADADARCSSSARGNVAGRSAARAPTARPFADDLGQDVG
jgi:transposase-like protein